MLKLLIKVKPNSSKDEISVDAENNFTVKIRAKPIDGEANAYLIKYLAKKFDISHTLIHIEKGITSRLKRIILNIDMAKLQELIKLYKNHVD